MTWQEKAVCRTKHQPEAWFPINLDGAEPAREVCLVECPVRDLCARFAFDAGENAGVWGGYALPWERTQLARFVGADMTVRWCATCDTEFQSRVAWRECGPCRNAKRNDARPVDDVREHLEALRRDTDATLRAISAASGVSRTVVKAITAGRQRTASPGVADRLLALTAEAVSA